MVMDRGEYKLLADFNSIKVRLEPQVGELLPVFSQISIP